MRLQILVLRLLFPFSPLLHFLFNWANLDLNVFSERRGEERRKGYQCARSAWQTFAHNWDRNEQTESVWCSVRYKMETSFQSKDASCGKGSVFTEGVMQNFVSKLYRVSEASHSEQMALRRHGIKRTNNQIRGEVQVSTPFAYLCCWRVRGNERSNSKSNHSYFRFMWKKETQPKTLLPLFSKIRWTLATRIQSITNFINKISLSFERYSAACAVAQQIQQQLCYSTV